MKGKRKQIKELMIRISTVPRDGWLRVDRSENTVTHTALGAQVHLPKERQWPGPLWLNWEAEWMIVPNVPVDDAAKEETVDS